MTESDLTRLATLYYVDGCTQEHLSREFGISRATVGRLLRRAQEEGIVEIRVRPHAVVSGDLERQLTERFRIRRALLAVDAATQIALANEVVAKKLSVRDTEKLATRASLGQKNARTG